MHDIKAIRDNPQAFDAGLARRGLAALSPSLLDLDQQKRAVQNTLQDMLSRRNALSKDVGEAMKKGEKEKAESIKSEVAGLKDALGHNEEIERQLTIKLNDALAAIPNIPFNEVPDGVDEHGNIEVRRLITSLGARKEPITYWLTIGDQVIHNSFDKRIAEIRLGLTGQIPDGLLFRISSIDENSVNAFAMQQKFAADMMQAVSPPTRKQLSGLTASSPAS